MRHVSDDEVRVEALSDPDGGLDLMLVPGLAFTASGKRLGRFVCLMGTNINLCRKLRIAILVIPLKF